MVNATPFLNTPPLQHHARWCTPGSSHNLHILLDSVKLDVANWKYLKQLSVVGLHEPIDSGLGSDDLAINSQVARANPVYYGLDFKLGFSNRENIKNTGLSRFFE